MYMLVLYIYSHTSHTSHTTDILSCHTGTLYPLPSPTLSCLPSTTTVHHILPPTYYRPLLPCLLHYRPHFTLTLYTYTYTLHLHFTLTLTLTLTGYGAEIRPRVDRTDPVFRPRLQGHGRGAGEPPIDRAVRDVQRGGLLVRMYACMHACM
jgi:hypothetical protein